MLRNSCKLTAMAAIAVAFVISCRRGIDGNVKISELEHDHICTINQQDHPIGNLNSLFVLEDGKFLLCTDSEVLLYDAEGQLLHEIGRSGRASGEYSMPMAVRAYGDTIYVWSAMTLKFIAYHIDGTFIDEYPYASALNDFIAGEGELYISPVGKRGDNVIDIYSLKLKDVEKTLTKAAESHKQTRWFSVCPMTLSDGSLYYMSRSGLDVYHHELSLSDEPEVVCAFESGSFKPLAEQDAVTLSGNGGKRSKYLDKASFTVQVMPFKDHFAVLTYEGEYYMDGKIRKKDRRYYSLYEVSEKRARRLFSFPATDISDFALISTRGNEIYFIGHSIENDEDVYALNRLSL